MTALRKPAIALFLAGTLASAVAPAAFADVPDAGSYTTANVSAQSPFGGVAVNTSISGFAAFSAFTAGLSEAQLDDIVSRCVVIEPNAATYGEAASSFCQNLFLTVGDWTDYQMQSWELTGGEFPPHDPITVGDDDEANA